MTATVPTIPTKITLDDLRFRLGDLMQAAYDHAKITGDVSYVREVLALSRETYEQAMKPAAHRGELTWDYVNLMGSVLDKCDSKFRLLQENAR